MRCRAVCHESRLQMQQAVRLVKQLLRVGRVSSVEGGQSVQLRAFDEYSPPILPIPRISEFQAWFLASLLLLCCASDVPAVMEEGREVFPYCKCPRVAVFHCSLCH